MMEFYKGNGKVKGFICGVVVGASLMGTAFAVNVPNPIKDLPVQEQIDRIVEAVDAQFNDVSRSLSLAQTFFYDIDGRLTVIEKKLKIKRDE